MNFGLWNNSSLQGSTSLSTNNPTISHHYTRSIKPSATSHCFVPWRHSFDHYCPNWSLWSSMYQAAKTPSSFSATLLLNMLLVLNFQKRKKPKYSKTDFTVELLRPWIIFIWYFLTFVFCLTWTCPSKNSCNSFVFNVVHNYFGMLTSVRLKQSWIC